MFFSSLSEPICLLRSSVFWTLVAYCSFFLISSSICALYFNSWLTSLSLPISATLAAALEASCCRSFSLSLASVYAALRSAHFFVSVRSCPTVCG